MTHPLKQNYWNAHPLADQVERASNDPAARELWAYLDGVSHGPAEPVRLYVHCTAERFSVRVVLDDPSQAVAWELKDLAGLRQHTPEDAAVNGCGWHSPVILPLTSGWRPGPYRVELSAEQDGEQLQAEAFFVLRNEAQANRASRIAMVLTTSTWNAYNDWGGANSYRSVQEDGASIDMPAPVLSTQRPWARGFLSLPADMPRHGDASGDLAPGEGPSYPCIDWALERGYSRHCSDAGWAFYERPFHHWLIEQGYQVDLLTQEDLHLRPACLDGYGVALLVGHDEYWSWEMRDAMDAFVERGGRLARFAGNMLWQIRLDLEAGLQTCYKLASYDPVHESEEPRRTTTYWDSVLVNRPAAASFGITASSGGYHRYGLCSPRASGGYTVYKPDHWALAGSGLFYGDVFGAGESRIVGFEVDGADYGMRFGQPYATGRDGAPQDLEIIAMVPATKGERAAPGQVLNAPLADGLGLMQAVPSINDRTPEQAEFGAGMVVAFQRGRGQVFNAGCCAWVTGLIRRDVSVEGITNNVLRKFLQPQL
ncbi:N,N-dimethylformamidase beta subunit family domain-containing protein [Pelomonas sp. SE-A7]|uniref:N,N-dimethylformamidase beta subunit family domain-containing protein n=1 Tax=Pelomonas sp. SE-A7 TaxID=3054953 RepID=UPI00259D0041|nr:N,N-dimethylformamidase beta subunit family domain-containing protein [Pelomonas sp. SE-A7]MDM4766848.1 hypothetical protein [Pelomonas sp. SE-A7]